jgi:acetyl-CoA carboxylase biotin carboxyl carrier protein
MNKDESGMNQKQIFELMEKFEDSRLTELNIESEGFTITLKSESAPMAVPMTSYAPAVAAVPNAPQTGVPVQSAEPDIVVPTQPDTEIITSPIVGTFYRSPAPDAPAYVDEGSKVVAGDSICIIEAMKIMNKLEADFSCEIVKILAESGQMVEYGAPLFEVKRI